MKRVSLLIFLFPALFPLPAFASSGTTLGISPQRGSYPANTPFTVAVQISSNQNFNAAHADVSLSPNLIIQNVQPGNCNFTFLKTPTTQNLSFTGAMLGAYSTNCTVFTATLVGNGSVSFTNAAVKAYQTSTNILTQVKNGTFSTKTTQVHKQSQPMTVVTPTPQPSFFSNLLHFFFH